MWLKHIIPYFIEYEVSKEVSGNKFRARLFFSKNNSDFKFNLKKKTILAKTKLDRDN